MEYDPIKDRLGALFGRSPLLKRAFFGILNLVFLRAWYVKKEIRRVFAEIETRPIRVLDAGTGFGQYTYWMCRNFDDVVITAVDIKDDYLNELRKLLSATGLDHRVRLAVDDLTKLTAEGQFDFVLSVDVMEHIEDDRAVFRNFKRVLAPGGRVLVNTPSDLGGSDIKEEGDESFIGEHVRDGYNREELEEKLSTAGLQPIRTIFTYGPWGSLAWRLLIKYPMQLLSLSWLLLILLPFYYVLALPIGLVLNAIDVSRDNAAGTGLLVVSG
ncbi:MAG: class I SAM-dependent methyltransferase [Bacteroidetes bacterium]|nr:class I SAM-dependent methyltransferase [Bacteroidota bacterium]